MLVARLDLSPTLTVVQIYTVLCSIALQLPFVETKHITDAINTQNDASSSADLVFEKSEKNPMISIMIIVRSCVIQLCAQ